MRSGRWLDAVLPILVGDALAAGFWRPLRSGAGFLGGDVYNYFMPLRTYYAEGLKRGELRFWHPKIGNGVSVLGESQTGMFYPPNLIAYRYLDVIPAYSAVFLFHYILAFAFFYWLARDRGLNRAASLFGAVVFVYSWFPPKSCLEWSVTTGCWLPLELLLTYRFLESGRRIFGYALSFTFCVHLLAGHYQLAWVSIVAVGLAALLHSALWKRKLLIVAFVYAGVVLAAPQLLPTWQLKQLSKRAEAGFTEEVLYGRIPPKYLLQLVNPWMYPDADAWLKWAGGDSNRIEAHFSLGFAGLLLLMAAAFRRHAMLESWRWWLMLGLGLLLATGVPFAVLKHVPGFSFFRYPGRYSLIAAVFAGLLIARSLQDGVGGRFKGWMIAILLGGVGLFEYHWSSQAMTYVVMQNPPVLDRVKDSEVFKRLTPSDRILAPDGNTLAVGPCATVPPYIGLQPALYYELWNDVPNIFQGREPPTPKLIKRLQEVGVTHILTEKPLLAEWPATLVWSGYDPFLHPRWGRNPAEPLWLYRFDASRGRAYLDGIDEKPRVSVESDRIVVDLPTVESPTVLHLTDWHAHQVVMDNFNNWRASIDGAPGYLSEYDSLMAVKVPKDAKQVVFEYRPRDTYFGAMMSAGLFGAALAFELIWRMRRRLAESAR